MSQTPPPMPRWVKVLGIVFVVLILIVIGVHLAGFNFGGHMPHVP